MQGLIKVRLIPRGVDDTKWFSSVGLQDWGFVEGQGGIFRAVPCSLRMGRHLCPVLTTVLQ